MSFEISVEKARTAIIIRYEGDVSFATWLQAHAAMTALDDGEALRNARFIVADFTQATLASFSTKDMTGRSVDLIMKTTTFNADLTIVTIAPGNLEYGMIRMLQSYVEDRSPWQSHLVKSRDECDELLLRLA